MMKSICCCESEGLGIPVLSAEDRRKAVVGVSARVFVRHIGWSLAKLRNFVAEFHQSNVIKS